MGQEFDRYSKNYNAVLEESLKISGYDTFHFVRAKLKKLAQLNPMERKSPIDFLDYGCGSGNLCLEFNRYFPKARYFGVDPSGEMIETAKTQYGAKGTFCAVSSEEWKIRPYDIIFSSGVYHHIPHKDHKRIVCGLKKSLAPSGKMIIWEHNPINPFTRKIVTDCPFDKDAVLIPSKQMADLFYEAGFSRVEVIFTAFFPKFLSVFASAERFLEWLPLGAQYVVVGENPPNP
ncbi:MAG: class I SAM-dependent methyltransferase [Nitrospinae bacterium]|nr:class I SAM-dependent methyltransferase [Nitrospinota bacterium]